MKGAFSKVNKQIYTIRLIISTCVIILQKIKKHHMGKPKLVVLTGAGISAESGLKTFRDSDGLWEGYNVEDVATFNAWQRNPLMVQAFYNLRRKGVMDASPNRAHTLLASLDSYFDMEIITQNIDNLHERAGSKKVLHLHGEITKSQSTKNAQLIYDIDGWELNMGDRCELGSQLRPFIVWFGEQVPMMDAAFEIASKADVFMVIGTSLVVYPAASLVNYARPAIPIFMIDLIKPEFAFAKDVTVIQEKATIGMQRWMDEFMPDLMAK